MRLLVIEIEPKPARHLHKGSSENGPVVDIARDGNEGRRLVTGGDCVFLRLDQRLPLTASAGPLATQGAI